MFRPRNASSAWPQCQKTINLDDPEIGEELPKDAMEFVVAAAAAVVAAEPIYREIMNRIIPLGVADLHQHHWRCCSLVSTRMTTASQRKKAIVLVVPAVVDVEQFVVAGIAAVAEKAVVAEQVAAVVVEELVPTCL